MEHDDLILEAMNYRRHVGADLGSIRDYLTFREAAPRTGQDDEAALTRMAATGQIMRVGQQWFLTPEAHRRARGAALVPTWKEEDAWILLALWCLRQNAASKLEHIIAAADFINHAIPTIEEMHGALNRLAAAHLITKRRDGFTMTSRAHDLFGKLPPACNKRILGQLDCLRRMMDCPCCGVPLKAVRWRISLDTRTYQNAVDTYLKST